MSVPDPKRTPCFLLFSGGRLLANLPKYQFKLTLRHIGTILIVWGLSCLFEAALGKRPGHRELLNRCPARTKWRRETSRCVSSVWSDGRAFLQLKLVHTAYKFASVFCVCRVTVYRNGSFPRWKVAELSLLNW